MPAGIDTYASFGRLLAILAIAFGILAILKLPQIPQLANLSNLPIIAAAVLGVFLLWALLATFILPDGFSAAVRRLPRHHRVDRAHRRPVPDPAGRQQELTRRRPRTTGPARRARAGSWRESDATVI